MVLDFSSIKADEIKQDYQFFKGYITALNALRGIIHAVDYGRSLTADVRGVHIEIDSAATQQVAADWEKWEGETHRRVVT